MVVIISDTHCTAIFTRLSDDFPFFSSYVWRLLMTFTDLAMTSNISKISQLKCDFTWLFFFEMSNWLWCDLIMTITLKKMQYYCMNSAQLFMMWTILQLSSNFPWPWRQNYNLYLNFLDPHMTWILDKYLRLLWDLCIKSFSTPIYELSVTLTWLSVILWLMNMTMLDFEMNIFTKLWLPLT